MNSNQISWVGNNADPFHLSTVNGFDVDRIPESAKWSFVTRNVSTDDVSHAAMLSDREPVAGDLVLASVSKIAQHTRIQLRNGRRSLLYPGDKIVVAFGNRYAPDQFEAVVPDDLGACHLVAAGGVAARAISKHAGLKWPTTLQPEGFCIDHSGKVVNLNQFALSVDPTGDQPGHPVIAVLGTSMNSGKTTTAAALVKGFTAAGYRVAAIKVTGTGAGNDLWAYADSGAELILDFTDAGYPSTYKVPQAEILECFTRLLSVAAANSAIDMTIVEVADGLLHGETADLVQSKAFKKRVDHVLFAAGEAMGALAGVERLSALGIETTALSGLVSASRLASSEAQAVTGVPVLSKARLESPQITSLLTR